MKKIVLLLVLFMFAFSSFKPVPDVVKVNENCDCSKEVVASVHCYEWADRIAREGNDTYEEFVSAYDWCKYFEWKGPGNVMTEY